MPENIPVNTAYRDGFGPVIMEASLNIIRAAGTKLDKEVSKTGEKLYLMGNEAFKTGYLYNLDDERGYSV